MRWRPGALRWIVLAVVLTLGSLAGGVAAGQPTRGTDRIESYTSP